MIEIWFLPKLQFHKSSLKITKVPNFKGLKNRKFPNSLPLRDKDCQGEDNNIRASVVDGGIQVVKRSSKQTALVYK